MFVAPLEEGEEKRSKLQAIFSYYKSTKKTACDLMDAVLNKVLHLAIQ